jgi:hypothetical protein
MDDREKALNILRRLVYVLYLEIGALQPANHPKIAQKAKMNTSYFQGDKANQASNMYFQVENETDPAKIVAPFEERTGLTLEDVSIAFQEGDWRNKHGAFNFGGPKWARIGEAAVELYRQIELSDWDEAAVVVHKVMGLKNNQGYLVNQLERIDRRR